MRAKIFFFFPLKSFVIVCILAYEYGVCVCICICISVDINRHDTIVFILLQKKNDFFSLKSLSFSLEAIVPNSNSYTQHSLLHVTGGSQ